MAITVSNYLGEKLPTMPEEVRNYVADLLRENLEEMTSVDEVFDAVGDHIQSSVDGLSNDDVQDICLRLMNILHDGKKVVSVNRETAARKLDQTVDMSVQSDSYKKLDSIWKVSAKDVPTMNVDKNKLNRAEARSKDKALKRAEETTQGNSKPSVVKKRPQILATASQAPNRREGKEIGSLDIKIEGIDISFGTKQLVSGADLNLVFGHRYGLVGRNGIGKTTLLKMLSTGQLVIPSNITMLSVEQEVEGDDTLVIDSVLACDTKRAGLLDEEKRLQATMNDGSLSDEERSSVTTRLNEVYMEMEAAQVDKAPARAAHILLDMRAVYWLESYLQEWPSTILTVSHDRKFLNTICTDIVHLHSRRLDAYKGNYENYEKAMCEKLTLQQREFEAQQQLRQHVQEFIDKFRYNAKRASMVQSRIKMLERMPVLQSVEFESDVVFHFRECEKLANSVLQLDEASFRYSKDSPLIFQNICCGSQSDSRICIVGENGSGKTTLLKVLLGELNPTTGVRNAHRRLNIGYFTQHHVDQLDMEMSGLELIAQKFPNLTQEEYRSSLARFGLTGDIVFQSIVTLSGGQKSRLAFACLSLQQPNYLILDEPTNHLDVETVDALGKALNHFKGGVILVSHDERLIELVCKELWVVKDKTVTTLEGGLEEYKKHVYRQLAIQM
ncbi:ABC transporter domain-containing protein [Ditylenchus destructor]|uniref:ABC transporter domain-containing protein n=1 Tax=Ditylenchus destructor TaxID=166010 RepID=A0AAD4N5D5_9BILA|nr:ABC transporter domain-containing protein [Ditylenchus destructor]